MRKGRRHDDWRPSMKARVRCAARTARSSAPRTTSAPWFTGNSRFRSLLKKKLRSKLTTPANCGYRLGVMQPAPQVGVATFLFLNPPPSDAVRPLTLIWAGRAANRTDDARLEQPASARWQKGMVKRARRPLPHAARMSAEATAGAVAAARRAAPARRQPIRSNQVWGAATSGGPARDGVAELYSSGAAAETASPRRSACTDQPESVAVAPGGERGRDPSEGTPASEVPHVREHAPGDMDRMVPGQPRPARMGNAGTLARGSAPSAVATSAPRRQVQRELFVSSHLESA